MHIHPRTTVRGVIAAFVIVLGGSQGVVGTAQASGCVTAACANAHALIYFVHFDLPGGAHVRAYRMNDDGSAITPMTGDISPDNSIPDISVDRSRTQLAVLGRGTTPNGFNTVSVGNIDGTGMHVIAAGLPGPHGFNGISLSPDGTTVAIADDGNVEVTTVVGPRVVVATTGLVNTVAWSPDGRRIAYDLGTRDGWTVWVVDADGTNRVQLGSGRDPAWSPDGTRIVYVRDNPTQLRAVAVKPNSTPSVIATFGPAFVQWPSWSPDGKWIAYWFSPTVGTQDIRKIQTDGTLETVLLRQNGAQPTWGYPATPISPPDPGI